MNTMWVARVVLAGILIFASALAIERVLGWFNRPRRWVWLAAMAAAIALPVVATNAPELIPALGLERATPSVVMTTLTVESVAPTNASAPIVDSQPVTVSTHPSLPTATSLWAAASFVLLTIAIAAGARLAVLRSRATPAVIDGVAVKLTPDLGPLVTGLFKPAILVPAWVVEAARDEQRLILAHEREHIAGGDHWLVPLGALLLIVMPWNPAVWMLYRRFRLAIETDCDARVVAQGADRREYGATLIRVAGSVGPHGVLSPAWTNRARDLEHRVRELTAPLPRSRTLRSALLAIGAVLVFVVAGDASAPDAKASGRSTPPRRELLPTAEVTGQVVAAPTHIRPTSTPSTGTSSTATQSTSAPSTPTQQALAPGFVRVTGYTRDVLRVQVVVTRGGRIEVQPGTRVISTSGDTIIEVYTPALLRIKGDQYRAVAEALEPGTEVEIAGTNPVGTSPRSGSARGTHPMVSFDPEPSTGAQAELRQAMRNVEGLISRTRIIDSSMTADSVLTRTIRNLDGTIGSITTITNETIPALNAGEIRMDSESGAPIRVVVRFAGGIHSVNGQLTGGMASGDREIETTTPVLVKFVKDANFFAAFVAVDSTSGIKASARGFPGSQESQVSGRYPNALVICGTGFIFGIKGYVRGMPLYSACRF